MIKKAKLRWNALLTMILGLFGFGTFSCGMYGVPHVDGLDVNGKVTDTDNRPLKNMQVVIDPEGKYMLDTVYTSTDGTFHKYYRGWGDIGDYYHCTVVVNDLSGVYESTSQTANYVFVDDGGSFSMGTGHAHFNIQIEKK